MTSLHDDVIGAIENGDMDLVHKLLIQVFADQSPISSINFYYKEAIRLIKPGVVRVIEKLYHIDPNYTDTECRKLLHHAADVGMVDTASWLISRGAVVNASDVDGFSPLHLACRSGHADVVDLLIKEGAQINRVRSLLLGEAPLHVAAEYGHYDCVEELLKHGARVDIVSQDTAMCTPLHKAIHNSHYSVAQLLVKYGANLGTNDAKGVSPLHLAVQVNALSFVTSLIGFNFLATPRDKKGRSPLHQAVLSKSCDMLEVMVAVTPNDLSAPDNDGNSPLHAASMQGSVEAVVVLLRAGADLEYRSQTGETALCTAVSCARVETVRVLLQLGADPNTQDDRGVTPLHRAQIIPPPARLETIEMLMENGAKMNVHDHCGYTPLDRCVVNSVISHFDREAFKLMVAAGCSTRPHVDECRMDCPNRNSPLCWLVWKGDLESARFLVHAGCDVSREKWLDLPGKNVEQDRLLEWLRTFSRQPRSLLHEARRSIRAQLSKCQDDREILTTISQLPLPTLLMKYLEFQSEKEMLN